MTIVRRWQLNAGRTKLLQATKPSEGISYKQGCTKSAARQMGASDLEGGYRIAHKLARRECATIDGMMLIRIRVQ
jgi:hypothetical protein